MSELPQAVTSPSRTAFVLAGGGSLGAVQVGMLKALVRKNIVPDFVAGASVGAINGAYLAADPTVDGIAKLERIWSRLSRRSVFPLSPLGSALGFFGRRNHLVEAEPLRELIESELGRETLEQSTVPCHVVATDVLTGAEVALSSGPVTPALLASAAIPGVFPPVALNGHYLMDGGIANNTPISIAMDLGATRIVVLPTGMSCAIESPPASAMGMALHALNVMVMRQLLADIERFGQQVELIIVPPLCPLTVTPFDFSHSAEMIHRAEASTRNWLKVRGLVSGETPSALIPHRHDIHSH